MKLTDAAVQFCIDAVTARVAEMYADKERIPHTEALRFFYGVGYVRSAYSAGIVSIFGESRVHVRYA